MYPIVLLIQLPIADAQSQRSLKQPKANTSINWKKTEECIFPFEYNKNTYYACTKDKFYTNGNKAEDFETAWCSTKVDDGKHVKGGNFANCTPEETPNWIKAEKCKFPFSYNGNTYNACTKDKFYTNGNKAADFETAWCSTKVDDNQQHVKGGGHYADCTRRVAKTTTTTTTTTTTKTRSIRSPQPTTPECEKDRDCGKFGSICVSEQCNHCFVDYSRGNYAFVSEVYQECFENTKHDNLKLKGYFAFRKDGDLCTKYEYKSCDWYEKEYKSGEEKKMTYKSEKDERKAKEHCEKTCSAGTGFFR